MQSSSSSANTHTATGNAESSKKEEFRKYLEKTGVLDALTKTLVGLYEEPSRPQNAVDYIATLIGSPTNVDVEAVKKENEELKKQIQALQKQVGELQQQLQNHQQKLATFSGPKPSQSQHIKQSPSQSPNKHQAPQHSKVPPSQNLKQQTSHHHSKHQAPQKQTALSETQSGPPPPPSQRSSKAPTAP